MNDLSWLPCLQMKPFMLRFIRFITDDRLVLEQTCQVASPGHKNRHKGHILSIYVRPESRGQGVGKALLQEVIAQAKLLVGVEQLHLMVITSNTVPVLSIALLALKCMENDAQSYEDGRALLE